MNPDLNSDEIFEMACQIERDGVAFYKKMSEEIEIDSIGKILLDFAAMEEAHEKIFRIMQKGFSEKPIAFDPKGEPEGYLSAMADLHLFDKQAEDEFVLSDYLNEEAKIKKILRAAINREWGSIALYLGIKELIPGELGKKQLDNIIKEEMGHVRLLTNSLTSLKR